MQEFKSAKIFNIEYNGIQREVIAVPGSTIVGLPGILLNMPEPTLDFFIAIAGGGVITLRVGCKNDEPTQMAMFGLVDETFALTLIQATHSEDEAGMSAADGTILEGLFEGLAYRVTLANPDL